MTDTPGPWDWFPVYNDEGKPIALLLKTTTNQNVELNDRTVLAVREDIAFWNGWKDGHFGTTPDGRLIKAAPDLLEACLDALEELPTISAAYDTVYNAIKKATETLS